MVAPAKKIWRDIGLNAMGGVLSYPIANSLVFVLGYYFNIPSGIAAVVFVTTYSGLVVVCIFRIWEDVRLLTNNVRILVILNENKVVAAEASPPPISPRLFDEETYEAFQRLLSGFPPEYTVLKLNRLFFLEGVTNLPSPKLQELVNNQKAFSQLLGCLKMDDFIRTDGYSFSIQLGPWETKRQELLDSKPELQQWQEIAGGLIELNKRQAV